MSLSLLERGLSGLSDDREAPIDTTRSALMKLLGDWIKGQNAGTYRLGQKISGE